MLQQTQVLVRCMHERRVAQTTVVRHHLIGAFVHNDGAYALDWVIAAQGIYSILLPLCKLRSVSSVYVTRTQEQISSMCFF